jgi:dihydroneopterin aldolase
MQDRLIIAGLEFHGHCGITREEQESGQRIVLDLDLAYDVARAAASDQLRDAIDYASVANRLAEIGRKERFQLIETLAERLARILLEEFGAREVRLRVKKPHPPIEVIKDYAAVEILRKAGA